MENLKIEIKQIVLNIGEKDLILSKEDAKELYRVLNEIFQPRSYNPVTISTSGPSS